MLILAFRGGDLRAAERTYQLLSQVTGRAGRAAKPGRALLQTYQPHAPVLEALVSGDRDALPCSRSDEPSNPWLSALWKAGGGDLARQG